MNSRQKITKALGLAILYLLLIGLAVFAIAPYVWAFSSSFKTTSEIFRYPPNLIPEGLRISNYSKLFTQYPFFRWFLNSTANSLVSTVLVLFLCSLAAFGFAKYEFRYKNILFTIMMGSLMIPFQLIMTPLYAQMNQMGWLNTYWALIIPWIAPAFGIFMLRTYMTTIPDELIDAARIDGCSELRIYYQIILPLARPALGTLAIYQFMNSWNAFLWPLIVLRDMALYLLPIGLASIQGVATSQAIDYGMVMAGAFLAAVPIIVVFLFMQRQFISGLTLGSVKG